MAAWLRSTARWSTSAEPSSTSAVSLKRLMMRSRMPAALSTSCSGFRRSLLRRGAASPAEAATRQLRRRGAGGASGSELQRSIAGQTIREAEGETWSSHAAVAPAEPRARAF